MLKAYYWLCTKESILEVFRGLYVMPGIKLCSATCKATTHQLYYHSGLQSSFFNHDNLTIFPGPSYLLLLFLPSYIYLYSKNEIPDFPHKCKTILFKCLLGSFIWMLYVNLNIFISPTKKKKFPSVIFILSDPSSFPSHKVGRHH